MCPHIALDNPASALTSVTPSGPRKQLTILDSRSLDMTPGRSTPAPSQFPSAQQMRMKFLCFSQSCAAAGREHSGASGGNGALLTPQPPDGPEWHSLGAEVRAGTIRARHVGIQPPSAPRSLEGQKGQSQEVGPRKLSQGRGAGGDGCSEHSQGA